MAWKNRQNTLLARDLRNTATDAERLLWQRLRAKQVASTRFNRQVCIGAYICDFVARTPKLIVELDGGQHAIATEEDERRTRFLESEGYHVVRFWNHDVMGNLDGVLEMIEMALRALPQPLPPAGGELG